MTFILFISHNPKKKILNSNVTLINLGPPILYSESGIYWVPSKDILIKVKE